MAKCAGQRNKAWWWRRSVGALSYSKLERVQGPLLWRDLSECHAKLSLELSIRESCKEANAKIVRRLVRKNSMPDIFACRDQMEGIALPSRVENKEGGKG